jgi:glycerophosphoryl diester phosphodiesterase
MRKKLVRGSVKAAALAIALTGATFTVASSSGAATIPHADVIAHNGGEAWGPESTLPSFGHAISQGVDGIEFDVRFTRDQVPIVMHDRTLDRTTNCHGKISDKTFAQVRRCDAGSWWSSSFKGEKVPTLGETLSFITSHSQSTKLFVDVKADTMSQARKIMREINSRGLNTSRTTFVAGDKKILRNLRRAGAQREGYVFQDASGWSAHYPLLIAYDTPVTQALIDRARSHGSQVMTVQDHPGNLTELAHLNLDGVLANNLGDAFAILHDLNLSHVLNLSSIAKAGSG